MKLKKALIQGFGKFKDETFDFEHGLNVIYGLNEAGKSTLHSFIEAIFYGFIDPTKSRRIYLPQHEIYEPKTSEFYGGSLIFDYKNQTYRLTRNLQKNARKDVVKLFIESTGKDITGTLDLDPASKLPDIAKFIDIPYLIYKNTLSIRQLESETHKDLGIDLVSRLQNLQTTKTETFSSSKAIGYLDKALKEIGTEGQRKTSPLGKTVEQLEHLENERTEAIKVHEETLELKALLEHKIKEKQALDEKQSSLNKVHQQIINTQKKNDYDNLLNIKEQMNLLTDELKQLSAYEINPQDDFDTYTHNTLMKENITKELSETKDLRIQKEQALIALKEQASSNKLSVSFDELVEDRTKIINLEKAINPDKLETLRTQYETSATKLENTVTQVTKLTKHKKTALILSLFILPLIWLMIVSFKLDTAKRLIKEYEATYNQAKKDYDNANLDHIKATETLATTLEKYNTSSVEAFEKYYFNASRVQSIQESIQRTTEEITALTSKIQRLNENLKTLDSNIKTIEKTYQVSSIDSFKAYRKHHNIYHEKTLSLRYLEKTFEETIGNDTLDTLKEAIDFNLEPTDASVTSVNQALKTLNEQETELTTAISRLRTQIDHNITSMRDIEAIETDIGFNQETYEKLLKRKKTLENAIERINQAVSKIEEHFAPLLSEGISKYLKLFTNQNYEEIKVRKDLSYSVYAKKTNQLEMKSYFSQGTKDQIYFAMRLGILDTLKQTNAPLILDDAFIAYDDERLNHVLEVLNTMQNDRQILLFSCQMRENQMLGKLKINYHKMKL
jgi:uncharacterized protein YhaN